MSKINFFIPIDETCFHKGANDKGEEVLMVEGVCSTADRDSDNQTLQPIGFNVRPLINSGFINWNHTAKKDPTGIIGEPVEASINSDGQLFIKAMLYNIPKARAVYNLAKTLAKSTSGRQLGWSIEGIPTEFDPKDKNNILKADITGIAITPSPKNPSTFLQICKGEEVEEFHFDEIEVGEMNEFIEKAMEAESLLHVSKESVEGGHKKLEKLIKEKGDEEGKEDGEEKEDELTKSQMARMIVEKNPQRSLESYKIIHTFMANKNITTHMKLSKALDELELLLKKGEDPAMKGKQDPKDEEEDEVEEVEGDEKEDEVEEDLEKGQDALSIIAKTLYVKNMTRNQLAEAMIRDGHEFQKSVDVVELVFDSLEGSQSPVDTKMIEKINVLEKSMGLLIKTVSDMIKGQVPLPSNTSLEKGQSAIEGINNRLGEMENQLRTIARQPIGRKSITSTPIERFEKGQDPTTLNTEGRQIFSLSTQKGELAQTLFDIAQQARDNGRQDLILEKAVSAIELGAFVPKEFASKLNALKIIVAN